MQSALTPKELQFSLGDVSPRLIHSGCHDSTVERCLGCGKLLAAIPTVVSTLATIFNSTGRVQKLPAFGRGFLPTKLHVWADGECL